MGRKRRSKIKKNDAFTVPELIITILVISILMLVSFRGFSHVIDSVRYQATMKEMIEIRRALIGDERLVRNGKRVDLGYFGDNRDFPASLNALSSYFPYSSEYLTDAWGTAYNYSYDGTDVIIESYGSDKVNGNTTGDPFAEDIVLRQQWVNYEYLGNTVIIAIHDSKGNLLSGLGTGHHISNIEMRQGASVVKTGLNFYGFGSEWANINFFGNVPVGNYTLRIYIEAAWRDELIFGESYYDIDIQIPPISPWSRNHYIIARLPGSVS